MSFRDYIQAILANGWLVHGQPLPSSRLTKDRKSVRVKDDKWITVNPNKGESDENEGRGQHVLIGNGGEIKAGLGGKYNGKTIGEIAKKPVKGKPYANQKKPKKPKEPKSPEPGAAGATGDPSGGISAGGSGTINQQEQNQNQNQNQPQNQGSPLDIFSEDEDSIKAHFTDEDGNLYSIYCVIDDGKITSIDVTGKHGDDVAYFSDFDNEWHKAQSFSDESLKKIKGELEDHLGVGGSGEEEPQSQKELPMKIDNQTDKKIDGTFIGEDGKEYSFGCDYKGNNIIYFSVRDEDGSIVAYYYGDDDMIDAPFDDKDAIMAEKLKDALQKHVSGEVPGAGNKKESPLTGGKKSGSGAKKKSDPVISDVHESPKSPKIHMANVDLGGTKYTTEFLKSGKYLYCKIYKDGELIFNGTTSGAHSKIYEGYENEKKNINKILKAVDKEQKAINESIIKEAVSNPSHSGDEFDSYLLLNGEKYHLTFDKYGNFTLYHPAYGHVVKKDDDGLKVFLPDIESEAKFIEKEIDNTLEQNKPSIKNPDLHKKVTFPKSAYSKERKDAAMYWRAEGVGYSNKEKASNEAWKALSPVSSKAYLDSSNVAKRAGWAYTAGSGHFNRSLRGIPEGHDKTTVEEVDSLTDMISRSTYDKDMWLTRGISRDGFFHFAGLDKPLWQYSDSDLQKLVGKEVKDEAFLSCSNVKGYGFKESVMLNIYCPKGTQAMFAEPFSSYGYTNPNDPPPYWDGKTKGSTGSEFETILQRGTTVKFTKIYREGGKIYVDCDVIAQEPREIEKSGKVIKVKGN